MSTTEKAPPRMEYSGSALYYIDCNGMRRVPDKAMMDEAVKRINAHDGLVALARAVVNRSKAAHWKDVLNALDKQARQCLDLVEKGE